MADAAAVAPTESTDASLTPSSQPNPVAQIPQDRAAAAASESSQPIPSPVMPHDGPTAGQPRTHYHSLFSELLSWKNPRASVIAYLSIVSFIVAARYLDVIRWALKFFWMALAVTVTAEVAGKTVLSHGLATEMRPRRYYTLSRAAVDNLIGDAHELVNFFAIEVQRVIFVENVAASVTAFIASFMAYHLVRLMPYWVLAIIATSVAFLAPLVYAANRELIDEQIKTASDLINAQTAQVRSIAQKQADQIATMGKQYAGDYTGKVQEMLRGRAVSPSATTTTTTTKSAAPSAKAPEFPTPPTEEPRKAAPEAKGPVAKKSLLREADAMAA